MSLRGVSFATRQSSLLITTIAIVLACALLTGCGQSGRLYLPDEHGEHTEQEKTT